MISRAPSWVSQLKAAGRLVIAEGELIEVEASLARMEATEDPSKAGVVERHARDRAEKRAEKDAENPAGGGGASTQAEKHTHGGFKDHQSRKMKADADMAEMERDRLAGSLLPADAVEFAMDDLVAGVRTRLESWPDRLAPELYPLSTLESTRAALVEAVEAELHALSAQRRRRAEELRNG